MMVVTREVGQAIHLGLPGGEEVIVTVGRIIKEHTVQLELDVPRSIPVCRWEVWQAIRKPDQEDT